MFTTTHARSLKVDGRLMQLANRALVLNLVRTDATLSRVAIARRTGLSRASVSSIVDHLIREGLIREEPSEGTGTVGRRPLPLTFNPTARLTVGLAIDVHEISAALVDLGGTPRTIHHTSIDPAEGPDKIMDTVVTLIRRVLTNTSSEQPLGIGVAVPGMVRWPDGLNLFSPNLGWRDVPVRDYLQKRLALPVLVDNEVRSLALAEYHFGAARGAQMVFFLDAGYGIGGAVIIDGKLYRGAHGAAGEVGHNTVDPQGPRCGCGNNGCLEVFASANGLVNRMREIIASGRASMLASLPVSDLSIERIARAAVDGDTAAHDLLARAATYLGLAVANAVDNWDPELVILSGSVIRAGGSLFDDVLAIEQRSVLETGRTRVRVTRSALDNHAKVIGAATLVIADYLAAPHESQ